MNLISIVLVLALLFGGEKLNQIKEFLSKIDFESFSPLLKILGVKQEGIDFLSSEKFNEILSGEFDLKTLLPILSSLFSSPCKPEEKPDNEKPTSDYASPIKDVAPTDIEDNINAFFS